MDPEISSLDTLHDIKKMMEKSSRFISLSGWSGIAAGICGLAGVFFANQVISGVYQNEIPDASAKQDLVSSLVRTAAFVFVLAFVSAFAFTYVRSKKEAIPIWGQSAKRLLWNTMLPMLAGGAVILRLMYTEDYLLIAPSSLIFYGLAVVNGSKYTLGEIRYMGYIEIILGIINLWFPELWFWCLTLGFGFLHILYGLIMWWKYERKTSQK